MMNRGVVIAGGLFCAVLAFWAYQTSGKTRMALSELRIIEADIAKEEEHIEILRAEWAILNRPERLRFLVERNANRLQLVQIEAENYGETTQVPYANMETYSSDYIDPSDIETILQDLVEKGEISNP